MSALDEEEMDRYLPDVLKQAEDDKWSGILEVNKGSEQFGAVFLNQGQIAWAACKDQRKNLGFFLEEIGMIPKQRQQEIFDKLKALGKTVDFGATIEETGLISRSKLRECLRGHIRAAISSISDNSEITIKQKECNISVTSDLLFPLDEVMPSTETEPGPQQQMLSPFQTGLVDKAPDFGDNILENLASLTGYQYSFICNSEAEVLAVHKAESIPWDMNEILTSSTAWIVSSAARLHELRIGKMEFILVEHDKGSLIARCPSGENEFFIAASFNENGKPGVIKHKISELTLCVLRGAQ